MTATAPRVKTHHYNNILRALMVLLNLEHTQVDGQLGTLDNYDHFFTDDDMMMLSLKVQRYTYTRRTFEKYFSKAFSSFLS